jgi:NitT/TauT family transport system substrate-binding protein
MTIPRTLRRAAWLLAALLAALAGCSRPAPADTRAAGSAAPLTKVRFKTDWYPQGEHGGFYQALARGFYREAGLDVEIVSGGPGVLVPQLMASGQVDIAMSRSDDMIVYASQGLPFVIVGVYMEHDPQALLVHEEDSVRTFADLNHRSVMAIPGVYWMDYLRTKYHLDLREIPLNYGLAQFMADKTFIQQCFLTNEPYYVRKNGGHPRTIRLADSGYDPYRVIFTTQAYLRGHEEAVRSFIAASLRGWDDFMNGDPAPAKAMILKLNQAMSDDFVDYSMKAMRDEKIIFGDPGAGERLGRMTRKRMQEQVEVLAQLKIIPQLIPLEKFARFDLLPPELQREVH